MEEKLIYEHCEAVYHEIARIDAAFSSPLASCTDVVLQLHKTKCRALEYKSGSYIMLVVGPVKSGKSTLVNLIARSYVSPTHFLECTVRPSIISQKRPDEKERIVVYTCKGSSDKVELIDTIIDNIRGIGQNDAGPDIKSETFELTPENIKAKVELDIKANMSEETLLTSISTPGGLLMQQDVFIIDMPGFDGGKANIDNPVYDAIAQRADLIIFVQSSNSAISKVSGQFLAMLRNNNKDVPVCLIHNVFDSAWWRPEQTREQTVQSQMQYAISEIRRQGFDIQENLCFCINLGKVQDARLEEYSHNELLHMEMLRFDDIERILRHRIINHRDIMRLKVCMSRTETQLEKLKEKITDEMAKRRSLKDDYASALAVFDGIADDHLLRENHPEVTCDLERMKSVISNEINRRIYAIQENLHLSRSEVRDLLDDAVSNCEQLIASDLYGALKVGLLEKEIELLYRQRLDEIRSAVIRCHQTPSAHTPVQYQMQHLPDVCLSDAIGKCLTLPRKLFIPGLNVGGHKSEDLVGYLKAVNKFLAGNSKEGYDGYQGYLETTVVPHIIKKMEESIVALQRQYAEDCDAYLEECKNDVLCRIIPDVGSFDKISSDLSRLHDQLSEINLPS